MASRSLVRSRRFAAHLLLMVGLGPGIAAVSHAALPLGSPDPTCVGDCDNSGAVTVEELVKGVSIALGTLTLDQCPRFDCQATGQVTVDCLINAVSAALNGCQSAPIGSPTPPSDTATPTDASTPTATPSPTRTNAPLPTTTDESALAASARVATDPILRLLDFQASIAAAANVAGRARAKTGGAADVSGCQQLDCALFGTQEVCCSDTQLSLFFDNCAFDDGLGRVVNLDGLFDLVSDSADVCTGAIPVGASFAVSLQNFSEDISFPDGSFSRTFQESGETFDAMPDDCTASQPDEFGFAIRGDGRRFIDGEVQHFTGDGSGNIRVDSVSEVRALEIAVRSTQGLDGCAVAAALNGSLTGADVLLGTQFTTVLTDLHVAQRPQADALVLEVNGTVGTDCLGEVTLSTVEPLRVASGDDCFTAGRLQAQGSDGTVSATFTASGGLDADFGADGSVDQHFFTCAGVPADQCTTTAVALCGACTALDQCQRGLGCLPCSADCSADVRRCTLPDTFVTCADGVF